MFTNDQHEKIVKAKEKGMIYYMDHYFFELHHRLLALETFAEELETLIKEKLNDSNMGN
jgi:hypothetical protein